MAIKALFISHDGGIAGAQRCLLTLLEGLDRNRFSPHLVVPYLGELSELVSGLCIPITVRRILHWIPCEIDVPREHRWRHLRQSLCSARARAWAIAALAEREGIDLIYTNTVTCIEGALAARMTGIPHLWHIHEPIAGNRELIPLLPCWLYSWMIRLLSDQIIFPSHALAHNYPLLSQKANIVYNGLPISPVINRQEARLTIAAQLGIDPNKPWIATVGALHPCKDHITFLQAAHRISTDLPDAIFLIVGTGSPNYIIQLQEEIQTLGLTNNVRLTGQWPSSTIYQVMAAIDVLVISSEQESFGLTAIEALAQETPVVATRCGGPEEIIIDKVHGFLVDVKDFNTMAKTVLKLLNNPSLARKMGQAGRQHVLQNFTHTQYVKSIQNIMHTILAARTKPS